MSDHGSIGDRLRDLRRLRALTQEQLAGRAQLSVAMVQKLEQGTRSSARTSTFIALADALDVELSELLGKRARLEPGDADARVVALRDALLAPDLVLPGDTASDEPVDPGDLDRRIDAAWAHYWTGRFGRLVAVLPGLLADGRRARSQHGAPAAAALVQGHQLAACVLAHLGRDDLAVLSAERAVLAAADADDELRWASAQGTFAWTLLHQGRTSAAEDHAVRVAERIEPAMSRATLLHLNVWGSLLLTAMAAAVAGGREGPAVDHLGLARSAAGRFERDRHDYNASFGPSQVATQGTHAYAALRRTGPALTAAAQVRADDLPTIAYGRHLLDVAQAHLDDRSLDAAQTSLLDARALSPEWFRHQGPARTQVAELVVRRTRLSSTLRDLAGSVGVA